MSDTATLVSYDQAMEEALAALTAAEPESVLRPTAVDEVLEGATMAWYIAYTTINQA